MCVFFNTIVLLLKEKKIIVLCSLVWNINDFTFSKKTPHHYNISCIEIECELHKYGQDCTLDCGHCENGRQCSMDTGDCPDGCEEGWTGIRCDIRKEIMFINFYICWYI